MEIKRIIKEYYEQGCAHRFDNLDEMINSMKDTTCQNSHKNRTMNSSLSIKENESIINNLPKQKAPGPDGFTGEFFQTLKEEIISILHNLSHKIEAKGILRNLFYQAIITLLPFKIKEYKYSVISFLIKTTSFLPISLQTQSIEPKLHFSLDSDEIKRRLNRSNLLWSVLSTR